MVREGFSNGWRMGASGRKEGEGKGSRTHRFAAPRRIKGGSGMTLACRTNSTAFWTQFRTTSWSFCPSLSEPSALEDEPGLEARLLNIRCRAKIGCPYYPARTRLLKSRG